MAEDSIVIVGDDGTEHEFPAGMDPKKAAAIVRSMAPQGPKIEGSKGTSTFRPITPDMEKDPNTAFRDSLKKTGVDFLKGAASNLNPVNIVRGGISMAKLAAPVILPGPIGNQMFSEEAPKVVDTFKRIVSGDPEAWGALVGGLLLGKFAPEITAGTKAAAPAILKGAGRATELVGKGTEAVGRGAAKVTRGWAAPIITAMSGHPIIAAAEVAVPPALRGAGRVMQRGGRAIQDVAEWAKPIRPVEGIPVNEFGHPLDMPDPVMDAEFRDVTPPPPPETRRLTGMEQLTGPIESPSSSRPIPKGLPPAQEPIPAPVEEPPVNVYEGSAGSPEPSSPVMETLKGWLGMPRVKAWKPGHGPSQADMQAARDYGGGKDAARRLKVRPERIYAETKGGDSIPKEAQDRIRSQVETMTPDEFTRFLGQAKNPKVRQFIASLRPR